LLDHSQHEHFQSLSAKRGSIVTVSDLGMRHTSIAEAIVLPLVAFGVLLVLAGSSFLTMGLCFAFERPSLLGEWQLYANYQSFMRAAVELVLTGLLLGGTGALLRIRRYRWGLIVGLIAAIALSSSFSLVGQTVCWMHADGLLQ